MLPHHVRMWAVLALSVGMMGAAARCGGGASSSAPPPSPPPQAGQASVLTYHNDVARTGQNLAETTLTPDNVNSSSFGRIGFIPVTGRVDAEPLYAPNLMVDGASHNVLFIATEHDLVYAFDADTYTQLWETSLLGSEETPSDDHGCGQITPEIGVTATPVIDLQSGKNGAIFLVAMSRDAKGNYDQRLHALDLLTGAELDSGPVTIQATYPVPGAQGQTTTFVPGNYAERSGLLLLGGEVYVAFTSHCDRGSYQGWVMGYDGTSLQQRAVLNLTPHGSDGAVWMAGAGLAADSAGNIYLLDANGTFDTTLDGRGFPVHGDFGNAFLKLSTAHAGLAVADYFTPHNTVAESAADKDLGSGGVLILPDLRDNSGKTWHLAVGAGKDGNIYLVNRDNMGHFDPSGDSAIYQEIGREGLTAGVFAMPAYFQHTVYYAAVDNRLKAFALRDARLTVPPVSQTDTFFPYPGATPSVSANGAAAGIVWVVENHGDTGMLHAYDASDLSHELYNSNQAGTRDRFADNKFVTPMIADGKVYVGTPTGVVIFGLLP